MKEKPIDILLELAREGEIDPWDVDIIEATNAFLDRLEEKDLVRSSRALLYASILLRMKSEVLIKDEENKEKKEEENISNGRKGTKIKKKGIESLQKEFEERVGDTKKENTDIDTIDDLIEELKEREKSWKPKREHKSFNVAKSNGGYKSLDFENPVSARHEEDIEDFIEKVKKRLKSKFKNDISNVYFKEIARKEDKKIMIYVSLLFLASRNKIELKQDNLYGKLSIKNLNLN